jgi:hypothetical protein
MECNFSRTVADLICMAHDRGLTLAVDGAPQSTGDTPAAAQAQPQGGAA